MKGGLNIIHFVDKANTSLHGYKVDMLLFSLRIMGHFSLLCVTRLRGLISNKQVG